MSLFGRYSKVHAENADIHISDIKNEEITTSIKVGEVIMNIDSILLIIYSLYFINFYE